MPTCRYCFYTQADFSIFRPAGAIRCTDQGEIWPNYTLIGSGVWVYGLKNFKNFEYYQHNTPKGRVPCTILTKFTECMRVLSLHNSAKFGCFSSINDKTIKS